MDKRDFFLLLQKLPINIIPSPCFEHTVDFVAQLAPWVPFSPLSLLTGQKSKLCLQVSNLLQLQDGGQLEVSAEHSAAHWRAADPRPAPLRAANDGSTLLLLLLPPPPPRPCPPKLLILSTSPQHPNRFSVFARCLLYTTPPTLLFSDHPPLQLHFNHFWIPFWTL